MKKLLLVLAVAMMAGCSSQPPQPEQKRQPKPTEFLTGRRRGRERGEGGRLARIIWIRADAGFETVRVVGD